MQYQEIAKKDVGLLINFGNPQLEYRRFTRRKDS